MSEELNIHAAGSYHRKKTWYSFWGNLHYRFHLDVKVTDINGEPIVDLSSENFTIRFAEFNDNESLKPFSISPNPTNNIFPGFYKLIGINNSGDWDHYQGAGLLLRIRVDYQDKFATMVISLENIST